MRKLQRKIIYAGLAVMILISGCARKTDEVIKEIPTIPAARGNVRDYVTFIGNVTGGQTSTLSWGTNGVIGEVNVKLGDRVREGQMLAGLETGSLSAEIINSEIPFINALEDLEDVLTSETPKAQAYNDLKEKEYALDKAEKYKESLKYPHATTDEIIYWAGQTEAYRHLYDEAVEQLSESAHLRFSSDRKEHDQYEADRKAMLDALNKYAEVYNNYIYYRGHATENDIGQAAADIDVAEVDYEKALKVFKTYADYPREKDILNAQISVENAEETYNRRNLLASINGVVTKINAREGDYVTKGTAAFRLDNTDHLYIPVDVSEIDILEIHDGMKAEVILDADRSKTYEGVVTTISASGTESGSRVTFQTMVEIFGADENVKIGMTAEVNMVINEVKDVLIVPANAVYRDGDLTYVSVSNGKDCNDVPVTVGLVSDTVAEIKGGFLKEGASICVPSLDQRILQAMGAEDPDQAEDSEGSFTVPNPGR